MNAFHDAVYNMAAVSATVALYRALIKKGVLAREEAVRILLDEAVARDDCKIDGARSSAANLVVFRRKTLTSRPLVSSHTPIDPQIGAREHVECVLIEVKRSAILQFAVTAGFDPNRTQPAIAARQGAVRSASNDQ
jgi:hypothetical protein